MTNEKLEAKVKEALIEQEADDFCKYASTSDTYKTLLEELHKELKLIPKEISELEDCEKIQFEKCRKEVVEDHLYVWENLSHLKQKLIYEQSSNFTNELKEDLTPHFKTLIEDLENKGVDGRILKRFNDSFTDFFGWMDEYAKIKDRIAKKLTEIAENEEIDKVMQKKIRYDVIREFFPTPLEYILHESKTGNLLKKIFIQNDNIRAEKKESPDTKETQYMHNLVDKISNLIQKLKREHIEYVAREIYRESLTHD